MAGPPICELHTEGRGKKVLACRLTGELTRESAPRIRRQLSRTMRPASRVELDLSGIRSIDSAGASLLATMADRAEAGGAALEFLHVPPTVARVLRQFPSSMKGGPVVKEPFLVRLGGWGENAAGGVVRVISFTADSFLAMLAGVLSRKGRRNGAVLGEIVNLGSDAVPVVTIIALLLGLILGFQAAYQLRTFGAAIYVANLVSVSALRELAPLMTAVVVSGRSGSAIAAEIGTMKVGEELAALEVMGIEPIRFLVAPRLMAVTLTQPFLSALASLVTIAGGMIIGVMYMGLGFDAYLNQTLKALQLGDLLHGLGKSVVFGWLIVLIGAYTGINVRHSAEAVGQAATRAVVSSIFALIVADGIITTVNTLLG
jgi:phospholipid/cholesterol/gamma-HCH transport system permease protein